MQLTLCSLTALRIVRTLRTSGSSYVLDRRCDLASPHLSPGARWTKGVISSSLEFLGMDFELSEQRPLHVLSGSRAERIRTAGVACSCMSGKLPPDAFVNLGHGVRASGPEQVFLEMARVMRPEMHLLLGLELCGRFSRNADDPLNGSAAYGIQPATSVERLQAFLEGVSGVHGLKQARETLKLLADNAWSPVESLVAALCALPAEHLGYGLGQLDLNVSARALGAADAMGMDVRMPNILFRGTGVGLSYSAQDQFGLEAIAQAAAASARNPGDARLRQALAEAKAQVRTRIADEKLRDRDLAALGLTVLSVTREDLQEPGGFDRVARQVVGALERARGTSMVEQRIALDDRELAQDRQELIWSLMPGHEATSLVL